MILPFDKYQGTGNDFIVVNDREGSLHLAADVIQQLCDRRFGIGADGFIAIRRHPGYDFEMMYANSDGRESTMCGNGGRCAVAFAKKWGYFNGPVAIFKAIDGRHHAQMLSEVEVSLGMNEVAAIVEENGGLRLDTGSPHFVGFEEGLPGPATDFASWARSVRMSAPYREAGINVNLVVPRGQGSLQMRTYERGVEGETLSCGTGAVAAAVAMHHRAKWGAGTYSIEINTPGGKLKVGFIYDKTYGNVVLRGPAIHVFSGEIHIGT